MEVDTVMATIKHENADSNIRKKIIRKSLSYQDKISIIKKIEEGAKQQDVANIFGVARTTVSSIVQKKAIILERFGNLNEKHTATKVKRFRDEEDSVMEKILFSWFSQHREAGIPMQGNLLQENANKISASFGNTQFSASNGWLQNFKKRFGIQQISIKGENLAGKIESSQFAINFQQFIDLEGLTLNQIYNVDETGLHWKELPRKASEVIKTAEEFKTVKDRVTVMACANASGKHKIPLLLIGKSNRPRCLNGIDVLPASYTYQRNACMDADTFRLWYSTIFLPAVKKHHHSQEKVILLLDNAPSHPSAEELNAIDSCCTVMYLPPNTASQIQPMEQGITATTKRNYRKSYLREFLLNEDLKLEEKYSSFIKNWNLLKCLKTVSSAWVNIQETTLQNAWKNLLGDKINYVIEIEDVGEITNMMSYALQSPISLEETNAWLDCDSSDPGWQILSIEEITAVVTNSPLENPITDQEKAEEDDENEPEDTLACTYLRPMSAERAYKSINEAYDWLLTHLNTTQQDLDNLSVCKQKIAAAYMTEKMYNQTFS